MPITDTAEHFKYQLKTQSSVGHAALSLVLIDIANKKHIDGDLGELERIIEQVVLDSGYTAEQRVARAIENVKILRRKNGACASRKAKTPYSDMCDS